MTALITEVYALPVEKLYEDVDGKKTLFVEGIYLQAGLLNKNKRIYPPHIMEREVEKYTKNYIDTNRAWGELDHPPHPSITLKNVSHRVVSLRREGNNWIGKAMVLETPMGQIVRNLIESGGSVGTSSRGLGSLKRMNDGSSQVAEDFDLRVCGDFVSDPSAPMAFVNGIMEGVRYFNESTGMWDLEEEVENIKKEIYNTPKALIGEAAIHAFEKFLSKINQN